MTSQYVGPLRSIVAFTLKPCPDTSIAGADNHDFARGTSSDADLVVRPSSMILVIVLSVCAYGSQKMCESEECDGRSGATAEIPLDFTCATGQWFHHSNIE